MSYVSREGVIFLQKFPNTSYKFSVENKSLSESFILNDFWNWFTPRFIPENIAPNLVTLLGFLCVIFVWVIQCISENHLYWEMEGALQISSFPYLSVSCASFVISSIRFLAKYCYLIIPILLFAYQTLDGCDGKQARRTKNSTPLGEIFDHGVDAIAASIFMYSLVCSLDKSCGPEILPQGLSNFHGERWTMWSWFSMGMTSSVLYTLFFSFFLQILFAWAFYAAHIQHYHRTTFFMAELGACDLENLVIGVQLFRFLFGTKLFHFVIFEHRFVGKIDLGFGLLIIIVLSTIGGILQSVIDVLVNAEKPRKQSLIMQFAPLALYSLFATIFIFMNPITVTNHYLVFGTLMASPFGVILTTLNIARVTDQTMRIFGFQIVVGALLPMFTLVLNSFCNFIEPYVLMWIVCIFCIAYYIHFASSVIGTFCGALRIQFLLINPTAQQIDRKKEE